ncbi:hypothetical protein Ga0609869_001487 [Rhodovulum iodosum]|uniref:Lipoprotein n=1 Tax=Rhodovulum iodosum TaxID=68291 RepID=A0ABV3XST7_9RHOB|nr:hypothetical protein [Rhodovulum robiginosum]RSK30469.1 hypothetical protein EJA01_16950 [Rhodovulum robiginosum]
MGAAPLRIAGLVALMMSGTACSGDQDAAVQFLGCDASFSRFGPEILSQETDRDSFAVQAAAFFARVSPATFADAVSGGAPGAALRADARFAGGDTGWRLWRPVPIPDDPDAFYEEPAQAHYLIRPPSGARYDSLVLVGLPAEGGALGSPALAGRLRAGGETPFFTIEPVEPARCTIDPSAVAVGLEALLAITGQP